MRIGKLGSNVKLEVVVVGYHRVTKLYHGAAGLLESLLEENWLQGRIQLLTDIL